MNRIVQSYDVGSPASEHLFRGVVEMDLHPGHRTDRPSSWSHRSSDRCDLVGNGEREAQREARRAWTRSADFRSV